LSESVVSAKVFSDKIAALRAGLSSAARIQGACGFGLVPGGGVLPNVQQILLPPRGAFGAKRRPNLSGLVENAGKVFMRGGNIFR
jgi:hypothetical protein